MKTSILLSIPSLQYKQCFRPVGENSQILGGKYQSRVVAPVLTRLR